MYEQFASSNKLFESLASLLVFIRANTPAPNSMDLLDIYQNVIWLFASIKLFITHSLWIVCIVEKA